MEIIATDDIHGGIAPNVFEATGHGTNKTPNNHSRQPAGFFWENHANTRVAGSWTFAHS